MKYPFSSVNKHPQKKRKNCSQYILIQSLVLNLFKKKLVLINKINILRILFFVDVNFNKQKSITLKEKLDANQYKTYWEFECSANNINLNIYN